MTDEKKIEIALEILKDVPRHKVLEAIGLRDVQAEMTRVDAVSENRGKITLEEYDKYYGFGL
jgi:hypothetical protein